MTRISLPYIKQTGTLFPRLPFLRHSSTPAHDGPLSSNGGKNRGSGNARSHIWDGVFDDADVSVNATMPPARRWTSLRPSSQAEGDSSTSSSNNSSSFPRRQSLTLRESKIFNELFEQIFEKRSSSAGSTAKDPLSHMGIGLRPGETRQSVDTLFGKLRRRSKRYHDPTEAHLIVEQQRLIMESFTADRELLDWATRNVFNDNQPNSFPAKAPVSRRLSPRPTSPATAHTVAQSSRPPNSSISSDDELTRQFAIQSSVYPHLLASLISLFRDKFRDPHTALSIFSAARHLSVPSYVFGCTSAVYNELLATLWTAFRDLEGIVEALREMRTNGVMPDEQTRRIALRVKREAMLLASGQSPGGPSGTPRPVIFPEREPIEQGWVNVPVEHPTRRLAAQMDSLTTPPEPAHPSPALGVARRKNRKQGVLPERDDYPRERDDGLELT